MRPQIASGTEIRLDKNQHFLGNDGLAPRQATKKGATASEWRHERRPPLPAHPDAEPLIDGRARQVEKVARNVCSESAPRPHLAARRPKALVCTAEGSLGPW